MSRDGSVQRQFFDMLQDSQWWSADRLRDFQRSQLTPLLRHARKNVPFYEHRLDAVVKPNGDIDWNRWNEIPIVKRKDMTDHRESMLAKVMPPGHGVIGSIDSSGSTGVAITMTTNLLGHQLSNALRWRVHTWHALDWSKRVVSRMGPIEGPVDWPEGTHLGMWGPPWDARTPLGTIWSLNSKVPSDALLQFIASHKCTYLGTGPKTAHLLALEALHSGMDLKIEAMLVQSGAVSADDRDICRDVFGSRLIENYGSKEGSQMAHECPHGSLHINAEAVLLEVVDDEGLPVAPGTPGRAVITPFFFTAQPLIRYDQGDIVIAATAMCGCGRSLPVLKEIVGRTLAVFKHPDGRSAVRILPNSARDLLQCEFWQVAQVGGNDYEIRYVPRANSRARDEVAFTALFRSIYFEDAVLRFKQLDAIPLTRAGKLLEYVNEWSVAQGAFS